MHDMSDRRVPREIWVLLALCVLAYFPVLRNEFVNFDDIEFIRDNRDFNPPHLAALVHYWRGPYFGGAFPLTYTFLGGVAALAWNGAFLEPFTFRLAGLLLHAGCVVIVFDVLRMLLHRSRGAAVGAAVFAVHPLQVESVAWAITPYALLSLAAIDLYLRYAQHAAQVTPGTPRRRRVLYAAATLLFALAMLAKPTAMVCVPIAAALDWGWLRRRWDRVAVSLTPWCVLTLPVIVMTRTLIATKPLPGPPLWVRPLVALDAIAFYLRKLVWPVGLVPDYGRSPQWLREDGPLWWSWIVPVVVAGGLLLAVRRGSRTRAAALMAAFALSLFPVLGLLPHHFQIYSTVADRYVYLGMLPVALAIGWWASTAARSPRAVYSIAAVVAVVLTVMTNLQSRTWHDTLTLFERNLRLVPHSFAANRILGYEANRRLAYPRAARYYLDALKIRPDDAASNYNLANTLSAMGDVQRAIAHFERALASKPDDPIIRNNYGVALMNVGRLDEARRQFEMILAKHPEDAVAAQNLATVRSKQQATSLPTSLPTAPSNTSNATRGPA
jgi:hypothetical protein